MLRLVALLIATLTCPVSDGFVSSPYGWRIHPISGQRSFHEGVDVGALKGEPVRSMTFGFVYKIRRMKSGYGTFVLVEAGNERFLYAHLSAVFVSKGAPVWPGRKLGAVGSSGRSTGPHLHVGRYSDGRAHKTRACLFLPKAP